MPPSKWIPGLHTHSREEVQASLDRLRDGTRVIEAQVDAIVAEHHLRDAQRSFKRAYPTYTGRFWRWVFADQTKAAVKITAVVLSCVWFPAIGFTCLFLSLFVPPILDAFTVTVRTIRRMSMAASLKRKERAKRRLIARKEKEYQAALAEKYRRIKEEEATKPKPLPPPTNEELRQACREKWRKKIEEIEADTLLEPEDRRALVNEAREKLLAELRRFGL